MELLLFTCCIWLYRVFRSGRAKVKMSFSYKKWNGINISHLPSKLDSTNGNGIKHEECRILESRPPDYNEVGRKANELFNKGYYFGVLALDIKTFSNQNVELSTSWSENMEENKLSGTVEAKYHLADYNLSLTEKLNKNSFLNTEISYKNKFLNGLAFSCGGAISPTTGIQIGSLKTQWSNRYCATSTDLEIGRDFSFITSSLLLGWSGVFCGLQWRYNIHSKKQTNLNFAMCYSSDDFFIHTYVNNGNECGGSVCHTVSPEVEVGIDLKWWTNGPEPLYGVAGRYQFDKDVTFRGKINSNSELGFSYEQKLCKGFSFTMSTFFDLKNVTIGIQKFGLGLHLEM